MLVQLVCCPARRGCSRKFCTAGLRTTLAVQFRTTGTRTMLAGECPLCGAERLEDGAPASHRRYAASYTVPLQAQLAQIAFRHRLHLV